jgi:hypothetical protein
MAGKYSRDNRGRFAPKGAGATARGGRLKTASGNKRETQKIAALSGDRMSSVPRGAIGKTRKQREITMIDRPQGQRAGYNAGRAQQQGLIAARKAPSTPKAAAKLQAVPMAAGRRTAALSNGRRINIHDNQKAGFSAALIGKSGAPRMERKGLRNVSAAKAWAANPNARGPRLMGGALRTEASPKATWTRNAKPANTLGNKTGQSKTLNKFNSRPERTRGAYVGGRYVDKAKLTGRQPLDLGRGDDRAFGRVATKANRLRAVNARLGNRPDTAAVNISMAGRRGRALNAEISRNIKQQKAVQRAASKASNRQFKSDQSRAKKLRSVHEKTVVAKYSAKMNKPATEVRSAIRSMGPASQVKFFKQYVKENRASARKRR